MISPKSGKEGIGISTSGWSKVKVPGSTPSPNEYSAQTMLEKVVSGCANSFPTSENSSGLISDG